MTDKKPGKWYKTDTGYTLYLGELLGYVDIEAREYPDGTPRGVWWFFHDEWHGPVDVATPKEARFHVRMAIMEGCAYTLGALR